MKYPILEVIRKNYKNKIKIIKFYVTSLLTLNVELVIFEFDLCLNSLVKPLSELLNLKTSIVF